MSWVTQKFRVVYVHKICGGIAFLSKAVPMAGKFPRWFDCRYENGTIPNWREGVSCGNCKQKVLKPYQSNLKVIIGILLDKKTSRGYNGKVSK